MIRSICFLLLVCIQGFLISCDKGTDDKYGTFVDLRDNHIYKWVKIGDQVWMAENLAFLPEVSPPEGGGPNISHYYVYGYDGFNEDEAKSTENYKLLGVLYNQQAALVACPKGWHLPTDNEWRKLAEYISEVKGPFITNEYDEFIDDEMFICWESIGKYLKATDYWKNGGSGTNDFDFSALPGGMRYTDGHFYLIGDQGYWLSSTMRNNTYNVWSRSLRKDDSSFYKQAYLPDIGYSIRCIKD